MKYLAKKICFHMLFRVEGVTHLLFVEVLHETIALALHPKLNTIRPKPKTIRVFDLVTPGSFGRVPLTPAPNSELLTPNSCPLPPIPDPLTPSPEPQLSSLGVGSG